MNRTNLIGLLQRYEAGAITSGQLMEDRLMIEYINELSELTERWARKMRMTVDRDLTSRQRRLSEILDSRSISSDVREAMIDMFEMLSSEDMTPIKSDGDSVSFERGIVVCPVGNDNGHSYDINRPVLMYSKNRGIKPSASSGDSLTRTKRLLRVATKDEIRGLLGSICSRSTRTLISFINEEI